MENNSGMLTFFDFVDGFPFPWFESFMVKAAVFDIQIFTLSCGDKHLSISVIIYINLRISYSTN